MYLYLYSIDLLFFYSSDWFYLFLYLQVCPFLYSLNEFILFCYLSFSLSIHVYWISSHVVCFGIAKCAHMQTNVPVANAINLLKYDEITLEMAHHRNGNCICWNSLTQHNVTKQSKMEISIEMDRQRQKCALANTAMSMGNKHQIQQFTNLCDAMMGVSAFCTLFWRIPNQQIRSTSYFAKKILNKNQN